MYQGLSCTRTAFASNATPMSRKAKLPTLQELTFQWKREIVSEARNICPGGHTFRGEVTSSKFDKEKSNRNKHKTECKVQTQVAKNNKAGQRNREEDE